MRAMLAGCVVLLWATLAAPSLAGDKKEANPLSGTWEVTETTVEGKSAGPKGVRRSTFADGKATWRLDGKMVREHTYKLDPGKSPKAIDLTVTSDDMLFKGKTLEGIYQVDGDTLTLCLPFTTKPGVRPTEFKAEEGHRRSVIVFKRVKD